MPPQITLNELYHMGKQKQQARTRCFDKVLELCHRRVRTVAGCGGTNTIFEIPSVLIGLPLYDLAECTRYVVDALRKPGFLVQIMPAYENMLYISWDPKELRQSNASRGQRALPGGARPFSALPAPPPLTSQLVPRRPMGIPPPPPFGSGFR